MDRIIGKDFEEEVIDKNLMEKIIDKGFMARLLKYFELFKDAS